MTNNLLEAIRAILDDHKAEHIQSLALPAEAGIGDYFLVATATSEPHLRALQNLLRQEFKNRLINIDYQPSSGWCALDFGSLIVHLFLPAVRQQYAIEKLGRD